jgi:outer membrane autotransporter protein
MKAIKYVAAILFIALDVHAADVKVTKQRTSLVSLKDNGQSLILSSAGNISYNPTTVNTSTTAAIKNTLTPNDLKIIITAQANKGIYSKRSAISFSNAQLSNLNLVSGIIKGGLIDSNTINLANAKSSNVINVGNNGIISSESTSGAHTINYVGTQASSLVVNVSGSGSAIGQINSSTHANSKAIFFDNAQSSLAINNNGGQISAARSSSNAIQINNSGLIVINNDGVNASGRIIGGIINNGSGELRINGNANSYILGNVALGSNANSYINLNDGSLNGDISFGSQDQKLYLSNNGNFTGTINGSGSIFLNDANSSLSLKSSTITSAINGSDSAENATGVISILSNQNIITNSNIGASNAIAKTILEEGSSLDLASNNNSINSDEIRLGNNSSLKIGEGKIFGNVVSYGGEDSKALVEMHGDNTLAGNINIGLGNISLADQKILNVGSYNITADRILIGEGSVINISSELVDAKIESRLNNSGVVNFMEDYTLTKNIGTDEVALGEVSIADGKVFSLDNYTIKTLNFMVGNGAIVNAGAAQIKAKNIILNSSIVNASASRIFGEVSLDVSSRLYFDSGILGASINGAGSVFVNEGQVVTTDSDISVNQISLAQNSILDLTENNNSLSANILLNRGAKINIGSEVVNGIISSSDSENLGEVYFNQDNSLSGNISNVDVISVASGKSLNAASYNVSANRILINDFSALSSNKNINANINLGNSSQLYLENGANISGSINGSGALNISGGNVVINSQIGSSQALNEINIASNTNARFRENIAANNISISGTTSLEKSSGNIIVGNLNLGQDAILNLNDSNHRVEGDLSLDTNSILLTTISANKSGSIIATGAVLANDIVLKVSGDASEIKRGSKYKIIGGASGSSISAVNKNNIIMDDSLLGLPKNIRFFTSVSGNELLLNFVSKDPLGDNQSQKNVYSQLMNIDNASGNLLVLKNLLEESESDSQASTLLESSSPDNNNSQNRVSFANTSDSANLTSNRLNSIRSGVASGDESLNKSIWAQTFGSKINQGSNSAAQGYKASSYGFAFGFDHEVNDDVIAGLSLSYANSSINSIDKTKRTNLDSYQVNLYGSKSFDDFFINSMIGFAYNQYRSYREIAAVSAVASAKYSGQTYIAKAEIGNNYKMVDDFILTPTFAITAARNKINDYSENGAGTLNLSVSNKDTSFFETRLGTEISKNFKISKERKIRPNLSLSYGYDLAGSKQKTSSRFVGQSSSFSSSSSNMPQGSLRMGTGVRIFYKDSFTFDLDYAFDQRIDYQAHSGSLKARYEF